MDMKPIDSSASLVDTAAYGWRRDASGPPLSEVFRTIRVPSRAGTARKLAAFLGPGYLVAVGYMDPGNWATSLAGGSKFGYALLVIALVSNVMAIILQSLCARLAIATGRDLSQACRDAYPRPVAWVLWALAELAICATDLAEVIGTAIGLNLLFGLPLEIGVLLTALDVFLADTTTPDQPTIFTAKRGRMAIERAKRAVDLVLEDGTRHSTNLRDPAKYEVTKFTEFIIGLDPNTVFPPTEILNGDNEMTMAELRARAAELRRAGSSPHGPLMALHRDMIVEKNVGPSAIPRVPDVMNTAIIPARPRPPVEAAHADA